MAEDDEPGLEGRDFYSPERATFASGMHAVIVETDPDTAEITILKYAVVHDCGNLINPMIVEGQIHGGVAQGVGGALYERMAYDESGQLLNASFMDFLMPYVTEIPDGIDIDHLETPSPLNPLGIKGAGEAGVIPSAAVFAAAIEDAEGIPITAMPISPSELFAPAPDRGALMKIAGANIVPFPVDQVWDALLDPAVLVRTIPGCERLEATGEQHLRHDGHRRRGRDQGHLRRHLRAVGPEGARVAGDAAPGRGRSRHRRRDRATWPSTTPTAGTQISYEADAVVGGMVGGVGQRMLGVGVEADGGGVLRQRRRALSAGPRPVERRAAGVPPRPRAGRLHRARRGRRPSARSDDFLKGIAVGAGLVLLGVVAGRWASPVMPS